MEQVGPGGTYRDRPGKGRRKGGRERNNKGKGGQRKRKHEMHMTDSSDSNYRCYTETI